jgi:hypothetical protein
MMTNQEEAELIKKYSKYPIGGDRIFIAVYQMPHKITNGYCTPHAVPITFANVDWFTVGEEQTREEIVTFIKKKPYYSSRFRYLVIGETPEWTFTIEKGQ